MNNSFTSLWLSVFYRQRAITEMISSVVLAQVHFADNQKIERLAPPNDGYIIFVALQITFVVYKNGQIMTDERDQKPKWKITIHWLQVYGAIN